MFCGRLFISKYPTYGSCNKELCRIVQPETAKCRALRFSAAPHADVLRRWECVSRCTAASAGRSPAVSFFVRSTAADRAPVRAYRPSWHSRSGAATKKTPQVSAHTCGVLAQSPPVFARNLRVFQPRPRSSSMRSTAFITAAGGRLTINWRFMKSM